MQISNLLRLAGRGRDFCLSVASEEIVEKRKAVGLLLCQYEGLDSSLCPGHFEGIKLKSIVKGHADTNDRR